MMAQRYLVVADRVSGAESSIAEAGLRIVYANDRLAIGISAGLPFTLLPGGAGVILGAFFPRKGRERTLDSLLNWEATGPREMLEAISTHFWGSYVLVCDNANGEGPLVARDPSGALAAYYKAEPGGLRISNDVRLLANCFTIASDRVRDLIASDGYYAEETCLAGIFDLRPGMALMGVVSQPVERPFWFPWDHCPDPREPGNADAADIVKEAVCDTVASLCGAYERPLVFMSGGLDSSVVLAALHIANRPAHCLTTYTADLSGDERGFARIVAKALDYPLDEQFLDPSLVDFTTCVASHLPRPKRRPLFQAMGKLAAPIVKDMGADILVNGSGGDQVFCSSQSMNAVIDSLKARRSLLATMATFENICELTGCSVGEGLKGIWRRARRPARHEWGINTDLLVQTEKIRVPRHNWLDCPKGTPPGKAFHVGMLLRVQESIESPFDADGPPMLNPLIAQPVVEACLGIPSWAWVRGGRNRAVAREAFSSDLPPAIVNRRAKSGPTSFSSQLLSKYRSQMRERLLGGVLAEQQVIDVAAVSHALDNVMQQSGPQSLRLLQLADTEAWCRHWVSIG
ncbi:asparagine synthase-related protein [Sphingobium rhizovicinum]|uniref:asparagine synthase (glutamine-hydrolyzing) n=1 Tax=Sphingobium rhizovicinum TaxID=432308 RepID=A0ABV7NK40_9SPHN